jgi:hypothetical protein
VNRRRLSFFVLAVLAAVLLSGACSGTASGPAQPGNGLSAVAPPVDQNGKPVDASGGTNFESAPGASPGADQQLIVYDGTLDIQVDDLRGSVDQADQLVSGMGGHVAASDTSTKGGADSASVTYRIPADKWDEALAGLRAIGAKVLDETTKSEDVTGQAVDLDARIANARASETALQAIMDKAVTIDDVLNVQRELTSVRGDIESMTAQRDLLANRAALATLAVTFETVVAETQVATGGWDLGRQVDDALATLVRVGQGTLTLLIWLLIVVVPIVVPLLIILGVAVWLRRRWLRNHSPKAQAVPPMGTPSV